MGLMSYLIVRIAICIDGPVQLLKSHQGSYKLIVSMEKGSKPLFRVHMMDLRI